MSQDKASAKTTGKASDKTLKEVMNELLLLDNQVCFPLYAASRLLTQSYRPHLDRLGLTYLQYLVLLVLWETDGATVGDIGHRLLLDSGTLTPVLQRLQRAGLLLRVRSPQDERRVECRLTSRGQRLRRRAIGIPMAMVQEVGLELAQLAQLKREVCGLVSQLRGRSATSAPAATGEDASARALGEEAPRDRRKRRPHGAPKRNGARPKAGPAWA